MIYIYKDALEKIEIEVKTSGKNETGGILLGFYFENGDFLVTHALDAGPKAVKTPIFFRKDYKYSLNIQKRYFKKYSVDYIGEWHKHPNDNTGYSILDYIAMLYISIINQNPCIFSIVGNSFCSNDYYSSIMIYSINKNVLKATISSYEMVDDLELFMKEKVETSF